MRKFSLLLASLLYLTTTQAQSVSTISGTVTDQSTGETLIGASVQIKSLAVGTISNEYGFYSLTVPQGNYQLEVNFIGYNSQTIALTLNSSQRINIALQQIANELQEVVVTARSANENITRLQPGQVELTMKEIESIPVLFGERDPLKIMQLLPGIKSAGEGNSGYHVRGGNSDQNLVLLDEALVYNPSHMLGFFSTFNADAIKDFDIYKGGMPAQYGGRLSSVLDMRMNDGNNQEYHVGGGIGLIASRLYAEGPIVKDRGSFLVTARRTYADVFLKLSNDPTLNQNTLYFYDLNAKANYKISDNDRLFLSGYFGRDNFALASNFRIDWGNATGTLRWNHIFTDRLFNNTSFILSNYSYNVGVDNGSNTFELTSSIRDVNLKHEYNFYPSPGSSWQFGANIVHHTLTPRERIATGAESSVNNTNEKDKHSLETALYISNMLRASDKLTLEYGLRLTSFAVLGGSNHFVLSESKAVIDTLYHKRYEIVEHYLNPEPRLSLAYVFSEHMSAKASYTRNVQNLHLISNSTSSTPNDRWVQSSNNIKPEIADQVSLGVFKNLRDNNYELSAETYYKWMHNQIDYKDAADLVFSENIETQLLFGKGRAYGLELLAKKNSGKFTGWVGYTLSRTEKKIEGINQDDWYVARQDRTHDVSLVGMYAHSQKWSFSATWVYSTGNAVSFPTAKYRVDDAVLFYYSERNGYRMPAYHRLDLAATMRFMKRKGFESDLTFGIYNAYGRANPYSIEFEQSIDNGSITEIQRLTLFKFVPSITYNFKF
jgi:hypothetical protein